MSLDKLLYKISACIDFQNLFSLEGAFNSVGLTIQVTTNNRMMLCKIRNGKPFADNIIDDYIFIGSLNDGTKELSDRAVEKISDFVKNAAGKPTKLQNLARVWRNGIRMYDSTIVIVNEDIQYVGDTID